MNATDNSSQLRDLQEENELLISQLHLVQEELERYYLKNKELEAASSSRAAPSGSSSVQLNAWVDDELPAALAENARLQSLLNLQQQVRTLEANNSLSARLATALAAASTSRGKLIRVPQKLISFWNKENNKTAPASLGGKGHSKLLTAYAEKGMPAANKLLENDSLSATQKANAWTDLARHLKDSNPQAAAEAARHAYEVDPRAFRLKWLAFRMHKAGDAQQAEAALELLPADIKLSASEQQSEDKIRQKARKEREQQAKNSCNFNARRAETEKQLQQLTRERNALQSQLQNQQQQLQQHDSQTSQLRKELSTAQSELSNMVNSQAQLSASKAELEQRLQQRDEHIAQLQEHLNNARGELGNLSASQAQLTASKSEMEQQLAQRDEAIKQVQGDLNTARSELEALTNRQTQLTASKSELEQQLAQRDSQLQQRGEEVKVAQAENAALKAQLETLQTQCNMLTEQRQDSELASGQQLAEMIEKEKEWKLQQQLMSEEMARAEAQLDLIKEMLLAKNDEA